VSFTYRAGAALTSPNLAGGVEIGSIRINGVSDGTYDGTFELHRLGGVLDGSPDLRNAVGQLPSDDGGFAGLAFYNPRDVVLEGLLQVPTLSDVWGAVDLLKSTFNVVSLPGFSAPLLTLKVTTTGWSDPRFLQVRMAGPLSVIEPDGLTKLVPERLFSVPLVAPDPLLYKGSGPSDGTTLQSVTVTTTNLTNNGNANTPFVVRFNGARTNPQLIGPGLTGKKITYTGVIASGHWVEVGTNPAGDGTGLYAVDDTGADVTANLSDFTARVIPPGTTSWGTTSSAGSGNIVVSFRDAWL
jgi:hypothetical protein